MQNATWKAVVLFTLDKQTCAQLHTEVRCVNTVMLILLGNSHTSRHKTLLAFLVLGSMKAVVLLGCSDKGHNTFKCEWAHMNYTRTNLHITPHLESSFTKQPLYKCERTSWQASFADRIMDISMGAVKG